MVNYKLNGGTHSLSLLTFTPFGYRILAGFIDLVFLTVLIFLLKIVFPEFANYLFFAEGSLSDSGNVKYWTLNKSSLFGVWILYSTLMDCYVMQGTIGKQWMRIVVSDENGNQISFYRSLKRNLYKIISFGILGLGVFYMLIDKKKRGFHDILANTILINSTREKVISST